MVKTNSQDMCWHFALGFIVVNLLDKVCLNLDARKVGHWLSIVQSRLRSRPGHCGGIFQPTGPGSAAPTIEVSLPSDPLSNRACGSLAHGFPTSFILRHAQLDSVWFR